MSSPLRTCALLGRFEDPGIADTAASLLPLLAARGLTTLVQASAAFQSLGGGVEAVDDEQLLARAQLGIVIGGDGSLLYAARLVAGAGLPLLGELTAEVTEYAAIGLFNGVAPDISTMADPSVLTKIYATDGTVIWPS